MKNKLDLKTFKISDLNPADYNPRVIDDTALDGLSESLETFGYLDPLVVNVNDDKNRIVSGHQRYKVLKKKGVKSIECIVIDVDEDTEKSINVSLNNPEIQGRWDLDKLETLLADLKDSVPNFEELKLSLLENSLDLNIEEFGDFDEEDKEKAVKEDQLNVVELEFKPEDYQLFLEIMENEEVAYKSRSRRVQFGLKLGQFLQRLKESEAF
jgi:hypothetical protein